MTRFMGVFSTGIIERSEGRTAKFSIFRTFPLIRQVLKFVSFDMTYFTEHEPGMQVQKTPDPNVGTMGI